MISIEILNLGFKLKYRFRSGVENYNPHTIILKIILNHKNLRIIKIVI